MPSLTQIDRRRQVLALLERRDSVAVTELSERFAVSEVTVRTDLSELARQGLVARVRGGVRPLQRGHSELAFDLRLRLEADAKRAIAREAAALVEEGDAVALDSSTTAYYLALELRGRREIVVVTNGLVTAAALADAPGITVLVTGGTVRLPSMSLVGELGALALRTTRINKGFFGARGLSVERGLVDLNPEEVALKHEMAAACDKVIGVVDGTKWQRTALLSFVAADELHCIVTDASAPLEAAADWRGHGIEVRVAAVGERDRTPSPALDLRRDQAGGAAPRR
jgi:DeoR/GlpR family transcriptional regulator of sugar metabolism